MKHRHAELIKAWADGAKIQILYTDDPQYWEDREHPTWHPEAIYRIKPEPKPDKVWYAKTFYDKCNELVVVNRWVSKCTNSNVKFTFDGDTGEIKSAEVI